MSKKDVNYWKRIESSDKIFLKDEESIENAMEETSESAGIMYDVEKNQEITTELATWLIFELKDQRNEDIKLMVKIVDNEFSLLKLRPIEDYDPDIRSVLIENEIYWMFEEPEDPENFDSSDLEFANTIEWTVKNKKGEEVTTNYNMKDPGTVFGESTYTPEESGVDENLFTSITEYDNDDNDQEIVIIEEGEDDGYVTVFTGTPIKDNEVEVFKS